MRSIELTQGQVAWVDDEDFERVNAFKWYADKKGNTFYAVRAGVINGKRTTQSMHIFIMGYNPEKPIIDHIDGNGYNNWKLNLRPCTHQENLMNQRKRKNCSSDRIGVYWDKSRQKWMARIQVNKIRIHLGYFDNEEDAAKTRDAAAEIHHGKFARLNFPLNPVPNIS